MDELLRRLLLAGTLGLMMARKAASILEDTPALEGALGDVPDPDAQGQIPEPHEGAVLRAILNGANECTGYFDDRPPGERWCDTLLSLLDLAAFARELGAD
jgi:hypothetical protein